MDRETAFAIGWRVALFALCLAGAGIFGAYEYGIQSSGVYRASMAAVKSDARLADLLGKLIRRDWLIEGSVRPSGEAGAIAFSYSVVGTKDRARVAVKATRSGGKTRIKELKVTMKGAPGALYLEP